MLENVKTLRIDAGVISSVSAASQLQPLGQHLHTSFSIHFYYLTRVTQENINLKQDNVRTNTESVQCSDFFSREPKHTEITINTSPTSSVM